MAVRVRAKVKAFIGGALRQPGDEFEVDGRFSPDVLERLEPAKAEKPKGKAEKSSKGEAEEQPEGADPASLV